MQSTDPTPKEMVLIAYGRSYEALKDAVVPIDALKARLGLDAVRKHRERKPRIEQLPLFATDGVIGAVLLGPDRVQEWRQMVPLLEARGLPKIDHLMGGRYLPAVRAFFDHQYGLERGGDVPLAPDGVEDFERWKRKQQRPV